MSRIVNSVCGVLSVLVADVQELFMDSVARVIHQDPELRLVATADDGRSALVAIRETQPDVAVLARDLGGLDGDTVLTAVVRDELPTRVVLLDAAPGVDSWGLLGAGAAGVLSRRVRSAVLRAAIHRVGEGGTALCEEAQAAVAVESRARHAGEHPLLSKREQQVLELIAEAASMRQIAERLQLSIATVRTHYRHLLAKLDARDRAQLILHAYRRGLIE